jgi:hypothetical protein
MAAPKKTIDYEQLDIMLELDCSKEYCADKLGLHSDTLEKRIKEKFKLTFMQYKAIKIQNTVRKLKQKAIHKALDKNGNDRMIVYVLNNLSDWSEKEKKLPPEEEATKETKIEELAKELYEVVKDPNVRAG